MPSIEGIDRETKNNLIDYCKRNQMTQIQWVLSHLLEDLLREKEYRKHAGHSDMSLVPGTAGPK